MVRHENDSIHATVVFELSPPRGVTAPNSRPSKHDEVKVVAAALKCTEVRQSFLFTQGGRQQGEVTTCMSYAGAVIST